MSVESLPSILFPKTTAGVVVSERGALTIADAYACVRCLADSAASLPLHVFRRTPGGRVRADDTVAAALLKRPAPAMTQATLVGQIVAHVALHGEAFVALFTDPAGNVAQLGCVPPNIVGVELIDGRPVYNWADLYGNPIQAGVEQVVHIKPFTYDGIRGVSPIREARESFGFASALVTHGSAFFANGARPAGILSVPEGPHAEELLENLRANWTASHAGPKNAGRTGFLSGEVTFTNVQMSLSDAEFLSSREFSTREVARIFRVPSWMINGSSADSLTYSTVAEQARAFVTFSLRPYLVHIEQALGASPLFAPGTYCQFELDGLLRGDPKARAEVYSAALNSETGWMNRAEVRALEDLPPEGGAA